MPKVGTVQERIGKMPKRMSTERRAVYVERRQTDKVRTMERQRDRRNKWAENGRAAK